MKRTIKIDGIRFISERAGYYRSECGRWVLVHMLADTVNAQWELYTTDGKNDFGDLIDQGFAVVDIVNHVAAGSSVLERSADG